jgi:NAD(P)-dependent dehydrogenase (short-subunit alcohol dehydrogenase family)
VTGFEGKVALITGGAGGIGAAVGRRLAGQGAKVVLADVAEEPGEALADEIGADFVRCDVRELDQSVAAVEAAVRRHGGLDLAFLNAGIATGTAPGPDFDLDAYRRAMGINLDGVVFGVQATLPALRARGGGQIVATASIAGLAGVPFDPLYAANKHAVVGLVRSLGPAYAPEGIRVNALCPSFARTAIIGPIEDFLVSGDIPILDVEDVVDAFMAIVTGDGAGECWYVISGRPSEPFRFRGIPGPRSADGGG